MPYIIKNRLYFLAEASKILSSSLDYHVTLTIVAKLIVHNFADFCIIDILENGRMNRIAVHVSSKSDNKLAKQMFKFPPDPDNKHAIYDAAKVGNPIIIRAANNKWLKTVSKFPEERAIVRKLKLKSFIFAPLKSRGKVIGVLTIASKTEGFEYTSDDSVYIQELALRAGIAVDKAMLYTTAQEAIKTRDEFLSIASHELKTPLTSILLNLQLMLQKIGRSTESKLKVEELTNMLQICETQTLRMNRLINDLVNVSITSTDRLQIEKEQVELTSLVNNAVMRLEGMAKKLNTVISIKAKKPIVGNWDSVRIEQVVSNILANAIKYGGSKPVSISVKKVKHVAFITIKDNGIGINKKDITGIFNRFQRTDEAKKHYSGLGVGLYISSQIVKAHHGTITVSSTYKRGSTFVVKLPL